MKKKHSFLRDGTIFEIDNNNFGHFDSSQSFSNSNLSGNQKKLSGKKTKSDKRNSSLHQNIGSEPGMKEPVGLRIIGGQFRGRKLQYIGDNRVRPMKDRVREAVFNLIGPAVQGKHVIDLFGGTGALTLEAISRGAMSATVIEFHLPTAALLRQNLESLDLLKICDLRKTDSFFWAKNHQEHPQTVVPWIVFCSPPYDFYVTRQNEMLELLNNILSSAPRESLFIIESDNRFDFNLLPIQPFPNKIRSYPPAKIAIFEN